MKDLLPKNDVPKADGPTRREVGCALAGAGLLTMAGTVLSRAATGVNAPQSFASGPAKRILQCVVNAKDDLGRIDRRVFGTNLEWFNDAGGLASGDAGLRTRLVNLARDQKISVFRYPGGTLADYYHWRDGTGPVNKRPARHHPTDPGTSANNFGSPEFFSLLKQTGAQGLITLNVGTGTAQEAADWVAYANQPGHAGRRADGFPEPIGIKLWEVGNEVYLPGNPGEQIITQTPEVYAKNFVQFADAIRKVDPTVTVMAIGIAKAHIGPDTQFPDWTEKLLAAAAPKIDMVAVHNAYFPMLYNVRQPKVEQVYPPLWASPEATDRSLTKLTTLINRFEKGRRIGISVTEWGALFSMPTVDPFWFDHVKTLGSGVYIARLLQVLLSQPRVDVANYFKFTDRSFMGWVGFDGRPKVPYWVFRLFSENTGEQRLKSSVDSPTFSTSAIGEVGSESNVAEVTTFASRNPSNGVIFLNLVNRSLTNTHSVKVGVEGAGKLRGTLHVISASEPTAHNGNDIPPEWPRLAQYDPYSTATADSIGIKTTSWQGENVVLKPFSVATVTMLTGGAGG